MLSLVLLDFLIRIVATGKPRITIVILIPTLLPAFVLWMIHRGQNWARWTFIIPLGIALLIMPWTIQRFIASSHFSMLRYCLHMGFQLGAAMLLLLPAANRWFQKERSQPNRVAGSS